MIEIPHDCPRGLDNCIALSNIISSCGTSFFCCGENNGEDTDVEQDIYTVCFKGEHDDRMAHCDKRDLTHQAAVLIQALAVVQMDFNDKDDWSAWEDA